MLSFALSLVTLVCAGMSVVWSVRLRRQLDAARTENMVLAHALAAAMGRSSLLQCDGCGTTLDINRGDTVGVHSAPAGISVRVRRLWTQRMAQPMTDNDDGAPPEGDLVLYACQCGLTLCSRPGERLDCCRAAGGPTYEQLMARLAKCSDCWCEHRAAPARGCTCVCHG